MVTGHIFLHPEVKIPQYTYYYEVINAFNGSYGNTVVISESDCRTKHVYGRSKNEIPIECEYFVLSQSERAFFNSFNVFKFKNLVYLYVESQKRKNKKWMIEIIERKANTNVLTKKWFKHSPFNPIRNPHQAFHY